MLFVLIFLYYYFMNCESHPHELWLSPSLIASIVGCLKITEDKSSDADLTPTRRSHFSSNANLLTNSKCGSESVQRFPLKRGAQSSLHSSSNAESSHIRVPTQTRISARVAFQLERRFQTTPCSNSNANLSQLASQLKREPMSSVFQ